MMKKIIAKQLGELLIDCSLINQQQLEEALALQKEKGGLLGQVLVSLHYVTEEAIAQALTAQYGFPYLPLGGYEIDADVAKIIPEHVAKQYGLIAVDRVGSILTIAMSNPLNTQAIEDVEMITHYKVQVFVTTASDVSSAIKGVYKA
jgi:type IV pilus assembly protein PilB